MTVEEIINIDKNWKEVLKKMIDNCNNYNDCQREILKLALDFYYEGRKNTIIRNSTQAKLIEQMINDKNK